MATKVIKTTFQLRRGLKDIWKENNPVLAYGEPGFEKDTYRLKIGDGTTTWNSLEYFGGAGVLRRDNDYNYDQYPEYIPLKGEVLLVDVVGKGLQAKVGDGVTTYANLPYQFEDTASSPVAVGYYKDGKLYKDNTYTEEITPVVGKIYIDQITSKILSTDGETFGGLEATLPTATTVMPGLVKLYDTTGNNVDGTMTQKAITDKLNTKVEAEVNSSDETLILSIS